MDDESKRRCLEDRIENLPYEIDRTQVQQILDEVDEIAIQELTKSNLPRLLTTIRKRIQKNEEMRSIHASDPHKFLNSEVQLYDAVEKLTAVSASEETIEAFANENGFELFSLLLGHPNTDLAGLVVKILSEMTDDDISVDLKKHLEKHFIMSRLVWLLENIEEKTDEDALIITDVIQCLENMMGMEMYDIRFVKYMAQRFKAAMDYNGVFASEILSTALQSPVIRGQCDDSFMEGLIRFLSPYRKRNAYATQEGEIVENICDCVAALLLEDRFKNTLRELQGIELLVRMLTERLDSYIPGLRLTDFALTNSPENCEAFVEKGGLRPLFGIFMQRTRPSATYEEHKSEDDRTTSVMVSILRWCKGNYIARAMSKFVENKFEKLDKLLTLRARYKKISESAIQAGGIEEFNKASSLAIEEERFLEECDNGLIIVIQADLILLSLSTMGSKSLTDEIKKFLKKEDIPLSEVEDNIKRYIDNDNSKSKDHWAKKLELFKEHTT